MKIIIKSLSGSEIELTVKKDDTIGQLHYKYYQIDGWFDINGRMFLYNGQQLNNDRKTLEECGIINKSIIHIIMMVSGEINTDPNRICCKHCFKWFEKS